MELSKRKSVVVAMVLAFLIDMNIIGALLFFLPHNLKFLAVGMVVLYFVLLYFTLKWMRYDKD